MGRMVLGTTFSGEAVAGELGKVLCHVTHALERGADAQRADDDAQVFGHWCLPRHDCDSKLVERDNSVIDLVVADDDRFRKGHI